jgi:dTDP-4-amino-4,6-dideoxygalactose transaminase
LKGVLRRPVIPDGCQHNAHMYYVLMAPHIDRRVVLDRLKQNNVWPLSHYVPLHSSPAGQRFARVHGQLKVTNLLAEQLIRLPLWVGMTEVQQQRVVDILAESISG